jgi:signal transduction histidine kinase
VASAGAIGEAARRGAVVELGAPRPHGSGFAGQRAALIAAALVGLAATVVTVVLTANASPHNQLAAAGEALVVGVPLAVGVYAVRRGPYPRFSWMLLAASLLWSVIGLSQAMGSLPYSIGRVVGWTVEPVVGYLVLAFPTGRLRSDSERLVIMAMFALLVVLWLPTALLIRHYPVPAPWGSCSVKCPPNAFMVTSTQPGFVNAVVNPVREAFTQLLFLIVVGILVTRIRGASRLLRRTQAAVLIVAAARFLAATAYLLARRAGASAATLDVLAWIWLLTLPGIAIAFLAGILRWRLFAADVLQRLTLASSGAPHGGDLRRALSAALDDPSPRVLYQVGSDGQTWVTEHGDPAALPTPGSGLATTEVTALRGQGLAIVHDEALSENPALIQAAGAHVLVALENQSLQAQVRTSLRELAESRAETQAAGESARRKIRQNLHDGAQQRLVALLIRLELAGPQIEGDPAGGTRLFHDLADEVEQTLAEIRVLSHGLDPSLLTERGLVEAVRAVAAGAPLPTTVEVDGVRRYPPEIEACVYFVCLEALSNAYKHAAGATAISVSLREQDGLTLQVSDDGAGFEPRTVRSGLGMASMRERLATVGGSISFTSGPGAGTTLGASIPMHYDRRRRIGPSA